MDTVAQVITNPQTYASLLPLTVVLVAPLIVGVLLSGVLAAARDWHRLGRFGLALFLLMTASAHFVNPEHMALMLPAWVPMRVPLIYATGVLEIVLAILVALPATYRVAGVGIVAILLGFLPANIYAAVNAMPFGGNEVGPAYLAIRLPYQVLLIAWTVWATGLTATLRSLRAHSERAA